jgi:predicted Rossmann fold flavoprotein
VAAEGGTRVVVVGAGAAGLTAAIMAAEAGAEVSLLETTADGGRKILISGGGRCNVLPSSLSASQYVTASSANTLRKILLSWPLEEQRRWFERDLRIELALERESGKLFPVSNRAREVRDTLFTRAAARGVRLRFETRLERLEPCASGGWRLATSRGEVAARAVVLATGGLSVPKTGSDGAGLRIAARLGHTVNPTYPALTPLTAEPPVHAGLAGISLDVAIHAPPPGGPFETGGGFLFTHRGYSGPSVLNVSHLATLAGARERQPILVRWTGLGVDEWTGILTEGGGARVAATLRRRLPDRLAERLVEEAGLEPQRPLAQLRREERARLVELLTRYPLPWTGDEGYRKAEVTGGGVALGEVVPTTLESRIRPGLFLCGELLDAFGPIGGYNFAWAWATGRLAGRGAARVATASGEGAG